MSGNADHGPEADRLLSTKVRVDHLPRSFAPAAQHLNRIRSFGTLATISSLQQLKDRFALVEPRWLNIANRVLEPLESS
jgi:hypothetical protein